MPNHVKDLRVPFLVAAAVLALIVGFAVLNLSSGAAQADGTQIQRSAGPERIATAVAASADHRDSARHAVLATSGSFPDALAAGALAVGLDAPMLLTPTDHVPDDVHDEIDRLGVDTVWVLGGTAVIAPEVEEELRDMGYQVRRVAGDNRFATAKQIALESGPSESGDVVVALGDHPSPERAWPDAVASGALAASPDNVPTLLTGHDQLPAPTIDALQELDAERVLLVGGEGAIEPAVEDEIIELGYPVERIAGESRYDTSVLLAAEALDRTPEDEQQVVFATGSDFPDALAAGSLAGALGSPLVLVPSDDLHPSVSDWLRDHTERWQGGVVVGGEAAASEQVLDQLHDAMARDDDNDAPDDDPEVIDTFSGEASYYGEDWRGRTTASGEPFDPDALTAAHKELPFDTIVRVTNDVNGEQVEVRINDRGPFVGGRVIDLSKAAAEEIDMISDGIAPVTVEVFAPDE